MVQDLSSLVFANALFAAIGRGDDIFAATNFARQSTRNMSVDELGMLVEQLATHRPEAHPILVKNFEQAARVSPHPFASPIHWGAQFVATTSR
jgi:hypothetical protein